MRFLADENFPGDAVMAARAAGHDVAWVRIDGPGQSDRDVLAWANRDSRILLAFDKDFGELAWSAGLSAACGIVLFRLRMPPPSRVGKTIAEILASRDDWSGQFAVVESGRIRMRPLP